MNALKVLPAAAINGIAVVPFFIAGGAVLGRDFGARAALRLDPSVVRRAVVVVGCVMTARFFL